MSLFIKNNISGYQAGDVNIIKYSISGRCQYSSSITCQAGHVFIHQVHCINMRCLYSSGINISNAGDVIIRRV